METSKKEPCYSWINTGYCANKDSGCQFSHKKFCAFFQNGFCKNGDQCTYLHRKPHQKTEGQAPFHHPKGQNFGIMQKMQKENDKLLKENEKLKHDEVVRKEREINKKLNDQGRMIEKLSKQYREFIWE